MKIAIVGSRDWSDYEAIRRVVFALPPDSTVISGGARGADTLAQRAADERWTATRDIDFECFPALWDVYGKSAGYRRNAEIVKAADRVIAFWDGNSSGTRHTIKLARDAGKPVEIYQPAARPTRDEGVSDA